MNKKLFLFSAVVSQNTLNKVKKISFVLLLCVFAVVSHAQRGWELGGWAGVSYYYGDLNTEFTLKDPGPALGVISRFNFNERLCFKFSANGTVVGADDANSNNAFQRNRNLSFRSVVVDGTAQLEFNFLPYFHGSKDQFYTPYLLGGFSFFYFNPKTQFNDEWVELRPLGTEGQFRGEEYYSIQGATTIGAGFKIDLNYRWSVNVEGSVRKLYTDFFDDVSGVYAEKDDIEALRGETAVLLSDRSWEIDPTAPPIGEPGRQRGNSKDNDTYAFLGVGILYYFGDIRCPPFSAGRKRK